MPQGNERNNGHPKSRLGRIPFFGLAQANTVAQLDALRKGTATVRAVQRRQQAKLLGIPDLGLDDEMGQLAGGDIIQNYPGNAGPWIFATAALVLAAALAGFWWFREDHRPQPASANTGVQPPKDYVDIEVIHGPR